MVGAATTRKLRVVVGDDHPMFRDGVLRALASSGSIDVVAEADDDVTALDLIRTHIPQWRCWTTGCPGWTALRSPPRYAAMT
jgi:DNA-binding NarL/FixJ family response regulator